MNNLLFFDKAKEVELSELPSHIRQDYSSLVAKRNLCDFRYYCLGDQHWIVSFDFYFSTSNNPKVSNIRWPEPILLLYNNNPFGCPEILSGRADFPKNIPHLNPRLNKDYPASFCVWRKGNNKSLYEHKGIIGLISMLNKWFSDAENDQLQKDGWEPIPRSGKIGIVGYLSKIQSAISEMSSNEPVLYYGSGSLDLSFDKHLKINWGVASLDLTSMSAKRPVITKTNLSINDNIYKWPNVQVYLTIKSNSLETKQHSSINLEDEKRICEYLRKIELEEKWNLVKKHFFSLNAKKKSQAAILVIAEQRPIRLIEDIPDVHPEEPGRFEIIPLVLLRYKGTKEFQIHQARFNQIAEPSLLRKVSNVPSLSGISIFGCGSLGATLTDNLVRSGCGDIKLFDTDKMEPHNNARHVLSNDLVGEKAYTLNAYLRRLTTTIIKGYNCSAETFCGYSYKEGWGNTKLIIDTTGSVNLERFMLNKKNPHLIRCYIARKGRLGIFFSDIGRLGESNEKYIPDMLDLSTVLVFNSINIQQLRPWIEESEDLSTAMIGMSCSSVTLKMPLSVIQSHAASFLVLIREQFENPKSLLAFNTLDERYLPLGCENIDIPEFVSYTRTVAGEKWVISISSSCLAKMYENSLRSPKEVGGFLLGKYEALSRRISVIDLSLFELAKSSIHELELPPLSGDKYAVEIIKTTSGQLTCLGTWHSHKIGNSEPSDKDREELKKKEIQANENPKPFVMLIQGQHENDISIELEIPKNWKT